MKSLLEIQQEVGKWAELNFGDNWSKVSTVWSPPGPPVPIPLGSIAPLLGMVEEIGEFYESESEVDAIDALGDLLIYFCDFTYREGVVLNQTELKYEESYGYSRTLAIFVGRLVRCVLKHHQGIRGFANKEFYNEQRDLFLYKLLVAVERVSNTFDKTALQILNETWEKVVSKRNWKTDPSKGGGHTHESPEFHTGF